MTTNKEAIEELKILKEDYWEDDGYGYAVAECQEAITAIDMAIEALEQQPCADYISRQAVLEVLKNNRYRFNISQEGYCEGKVLWSENLIKDDACKEIEQLPSITPKEKTAAWVPVDAEPRDIYECNACGWLLYYEDRTDFKYCPNCGARMVSE